MSRFNSLRGFDPHDPEEVPRNDEPDGGYNPLSRNFEPEDPLLDFLPTVETPQDTPAPEGNTVQGLSKPPPPPKLRRQITRPTNRSQTYGRAPTNFETRRKEEEEKGETPYRNFENAEVFELAEWMLTAGVSQKEGTRLLKTKMLRKSKARWANAPALLREVDKLPRGPKWSYHTFDIKHPTKDNCLEQVEIYCRDSLEIIKALLSDPAFNNSEIMAYEPVKIHVGPEGCRDEELKREYGEMHTGDWWNRVQDKLPPGATVAPVILSSDKTQLSTFGGDKSAWPVYLTIGNIAKGIRRKPSKHAVYLLGYLNATKLSFIEEKEPRSLALKKLYHDSMRVMLEPLKKAGKEGVMMTCADGLIRKVFPILGAYIADHPEQCLITCTKHSRCPVCEVPHDKRGDLTSYPYRKHNRTIRAVLSQTHKHTENDFGLTDEDAVNFNALGLHPVNPFWSGMPLVDEDTLLTPDILHQLHKGILYTHLLNWMKTFMTSKEIDRRFQAVPEYSGLRHFGKGITNITQMTGKEHKELEKVLMVIVAAGSAVPKQAVVAASALLNFIYLARFPQHTEESLDLLRESLKRFHQYKWILFGKKYCKDFNGIPKLHSMQHYEQSIREKGTADGFSTEAPERLHIEFAKKAYRASNRNDYLKQMVKWLERQEGMNYMRAYLAWCDDYSSFIDNPDEGGESGSGVTGDWNWFLEDDDEGAGEVIPNDGEEVDPAEAPLAPTPTSNFPPPIYAVGNPLEGHPPSDKHQLTKKPAFMRQTFRDIEERHQASEFRWYFFDYMAKASPDVYSLFDEENTSLEVWRTFKMTITHIRDVSFISSYHTIHASPLHIREDHLTSRTIPGRFDTVFVRYTSESTTANNDFQNRYRIAQVRVIFRIARTSSLFDLYPEPMAYVELFNKLPASPQKDTGLFTVARAFRQNQRQAAIVPLSYVHLPCHLTPVFGNSVPQSWLLHGDKREDPLASERGTFFLNPFVTLSTYSFFFRLGLAPLAQDRLSTPPIPATKKITMKKKVDFEVSGESEDLNSGESDSGESDAPGNSESEDGLEITRSALPNPSNPSAAEQRVRMNQTRGRQRGKDAQREPRHPRTIDEVDRPTRNTGDDGGRGPSTRGCGKRSRINDTQSTSNDAQSMKRPRRNR